MLAIEIQERTINLIINTLLRGITFYLVLSAVLTGYVISQGDLVEQTVRERILDVEIGLSFCILVIVLVGDIVLLRSLSTINSALKNIDLEAYNQAKFGRAYGPYKLLGIVILIITIIGAGIILFGLFSLRASIKG